MSAAPPDDPNTPAGSAGAGNESDRTIVRPRPGARIGAPAPAMAPPAAAPAPAPAAAGESGADFLDAEALRVGDNPILAAARPLLAIVAQIRLLARHPDPAALKEQLTAGVRAFEAELGARAVAREKLIAARYIMCTFIDEAAAGTPWGGGGLWAHDTLLVRFHNETWGGEKVFQLLAKLAESPRENRDLLELIYVCIALGFQGRYAIIDNGSRQLEQLRERLHALLRQSEPGPEPTLSLGWRPAQVGVRRWYDAAPFWAFGGVLALAALIAYAAFAFLLAQKSDQAFAAIASVNLPPPRPPVPPPPAPPRLKRFLEAEIREGLVAVTEEVGRSTVTIRGDGFFRPGRATVDPGVIPILQRIGDALAENPGPVLITGHSDNVPIRTLRFPSNWELSLERARAVEGILAQRIEMGRMQVEGRADSEPVAPNNTADGRARNRRVEITLFTQTRPGQTR